MREKCRTVDTVSFLDTLCEVLQTSDMVSLLVSGNSMVPFLVHRRDMVYLAAVTRPLKKGDLVLYRRDSGAYVLHRIAREEKSGYTMVGDAQTQLEPGIRLDQIRALVVAAERKGRRQQPGSFWWEFFEKIWIRIVPLRPLCFKVYGLFKRPGGKKV